jgi:hypothetical protein
MKTTNLTKEEQRFKDEMEEITTLKPMEWQMCLEKAGGVRAIAMMLFVQYFQFIFDKQKELTPGNVFKTIPMKQWLEEHSTFGGVVWCGEPK